MKSPLALLPALLLAAAVQDAVRAQECATRCVRTEIRLLDQSARDTYFNAVQTLQASGVYDTFTKHHLDQASWIHGAPAFFPWHRAFLRAFELELQKVNAGICLHYWAEDVDSQSPEVSPIFADTYYGGNGGSDGCVGGRWANWRPQHPTPHCLQREFNGGDGGISAFPAMEVVNRIITSSESYDEFRRGIEGSIHGAPHLNIAGDMRTMHSPNDPIFIAHHAYIDKLWWTFQRARPELATAYEGSGVSVSDVMRPFPQTVAQVFDTNQLCYTYAELPVDAVNMMKLPAPTVPDASETVGASHSSSWHETTSWFSGSSSGTATIVRSLEVYDPTDEWVKVLPMPETAVDEYDSLDRSELLNMRTPRALNATWVRMMGMDLEKVREDEAKNRQVIIQLNEIYGYVSPGALVHNVDAISRLFPRIRDFKLDYANTTRVVLSRDAATDDAQAVANLLRRIQIVVPDAVLPAQSLRERVEQVTGRSVMPAGSASSFLEASTVDSRVQRKVASSAAALSSSSALLAAAATLLLSQLFCAL